jgi:hypothetical protein
MITNRYCTATEQLLGMLAGKISLQAFAARVLHSDLRQMVELNHADSEWRLESDLEWHGTVSS